MMQMSKYLRSTASKALRQRNFRSLSLIIKDQAPHHAERISVDRLKWAMNKIEKEKSDASV